MIIRLKSYNFKAQYIYVVILYLFITHIIMGVFLYVYALRYIIAPYITVLFFKAVGLYLPYIYTLIKFQFTVKPERSDDVSGLIINERTGKTSSMYHIGK